MLRENTLFLKLSTHHDLVFDATHAMILELLHDWMGAPFESFQDLTARGKPRPVTGQLLLDALHRGVGQGIHQSLRFKLWRESGCPVRSFEFNAGAHPYTGAFCTQIDIRVEKSWVERNPQTAPRVLRKRLIDLARLTHPFQAHAHDTDDNTIQNVDNLRLLRRGFGLDLTEPVDLSNNPGRELSRGNLRYAVNWLTLFGPELLAQIPPEVVLSAPAGVVTELDIDPDARKRPAEIVAERLAAQPAAPHGGDPHGGKPHGGDPHGGDPHGGDPYGGDPEDPAPPPKRWLLLSLGDSPLDPDAPAARQAQAALREHLGFKALAKDQRYVLGYWQKKL